jgi:hypothetical protein
VKEEFMPWLEREYPELVGDYRRMYRGANAPKAVSAAIGEQVRAAKRGHRAFDPQPDPPAGRRVPGPPAGPEPARQLTLGL